MYGVCFDFSRISLNRRGVEAGDWNGDGAAAVCGLVTERLVRLVLWRDLALVARASWANRDGVCGDPGRDGNVAPFFCGVVAPVTPSCARSLALNGRPSKCFTSVVVSLASFRVPGIVGRGGSRRFDVAESALSVGSTLLKGALSAIRAPLYHIFLC